MPANPAFRPRPRRLPHRVIAFLAAFLAASCDGPTGSDPDLAALVVAPAPATVGVGGVLQFTATGVDENGDEVEVNPVWSVVNGGGSIGPSSGIFTAGTVPGSFANTVQAMVGGISATATVNVTGGVVASITLTPSPASVGLNGTVQFTATGRDAGGNVVPVTPAWSVVNGGGTIGPDGTFTAGSAAGTFANTVRAAAGSVAAFATVEVTAGAVARVVVTPNPVTLGIGGVLQFTATVFDAADNEIQATPTWSVTAGGGTIGATSGIFTAGGQPGAYPNTVRATVGGVSGSATVNVSASGLQIGPPTATVAVGGSVQFAATALDAHGNRVPVPAAWEVVGGGGTISADGVFTAGTAAGSFGSTVRAVSGGVSAFADVTVTPGPLASITVAPDPTSVAVGGARQFTATGRDAHGNLVPITPAWSVAAGGGTINANGLFTAGTAPGTYAGTVRATADALSGTATVTVTPGPIASFTVTPAGAQVVYGSSLQYTATARDAHGNVVPVTPTWSLPSGGGTITQDGTFTAGTTLGAFSVRAAIPGWATGVAVTVVAGPLASLTLTPPSASVVHGDTRAFTATGRDAAGHVVPVTPTWSVVNGGGTISASGVFTAGETLGSFPGTVRAAVGDVSATASVQVVLGPIVSVTASPSVVFLTRGQTQQYTATVRDTKGMTMQVAAPWFVDNGGGTIDANGLFTAGSQTGAFPYTVRAVYSGLSSPRVSVNVLAAPLDHVVVVPADTTVRRMNYVYYSMAAVDVNGDTTSIGPVDWQPVRGGAGEWEEYGVFIATNTPGTYVNAIEGRVGPYTAFGTVRVVP